jgi:hypothetical protein
VNTLTITDPKTNCRWSAFFHGFHDGPGLHESY